MPGTFVANPAMSVGLLELGGQANQILERGSQIAPRWRTDAT
jgi:hypothetical protein